MIMPILMGNVTTMNRSEKAQEKIKQNKSLYKILKVLKRRIVRYKF